LADFPVVYRVLVGVFLVGFFGVVLFGSLGCNGDGGIGFLAVVVLWLGCFLFLSIVFVCWCWLFAARICLSVGGFWGRRLAIFDVFSCLVWFV